MAEVRLSKSALLHEREQLKLYRRLLPSLDLKRRQLTIELQRARQAVADAERAIERHGETIGEELPMLANTAIDLSGLIRVTGVDIGAENIVGARVPRLDAVHFSVAPYAFLVRPAWVDPLVDRLKEAAELRLRQTVATERARLLSQALRRITQRVNLFERILIPNALRNIKRIQIFLDELERDAVIRSKLAKARHSPRVTP